MPATKLSLEFLVLTAARSGEVRLAAWEEMDPEARTWVISAGRMKARREHRVPLSDRALVILEEAQPLGCLFVSQEVRIFVFSHVYKRWAVEAEIERPKPEKERSEAGPGEAEGQKGPKRAITIQNKTLKTGYFRFNKLEQNRG